jgi:hypothetical protein
MSRLSGLLIAGAVIAGVATLGILRIRNRDPDSTDSHVATAATAAPAEPPPAQPPPPTLAELAASADLIFEGKPAGSYPVRQGLIHGAEQDPAGFSSQRDMLRAMPFVVSLAVERVVKGTFSDPNFLLLVHSPAMAFHLNALLGGGSDEHYTFYLRKGPGGRFLLDKRPLARTSSSDRSP